MNVLYVTTKITKYFLLIFRRIMTNKINYDLLMQSTIKSLDYKPDLLLHSCCAPCSSSVLEKLERILDLDAEIINQNAEDVRIALQK